jgi:hypothetical protein
MTDAARRATARARVAELVSNFKRNEEDYLSAAYNVSIRWVPPCLACERPLLRALV